MTGSTRLIRLRLYIIVTAMAFIALLQVGGNVSAQSARPYHLNGSASSESCNCYTLTTETSGVSGSVWNINKINLAESFNYTFDVFLGCRDFEGADGIAFVLQPISTNIGTQGEGLGVEGVTPSLIVSIDTYQNDNQADPSEDHIAININGDLNHSSSNNLAGPVAVLPNNGNIEDCQWHLFQIVWDAASKTITAWVDGQERVSTVINLVPDIFRGDPMVFWGFSGATGGSINRQRFCTSLNAAFSLPPDQVTCFPEPIQFLDSSTTFGAIQKWYWNFGDGTTDTVKNPPIHMYPQPGNYNVTLNILGNDGCLSDTFRQTVIAGSKPIAGFNFGNQPGCDDKPIPFVNTSAVEFGNINEWVWQIDGNQEISYDALFNKQLSLGNHNITLTVKTREGCISEPVSKSINILEHPTIAVNEVPDACRWENVFFESVNTKPTIPIQQWYWSFGDGKSAVSSNTEHAYADTGTYRPGVYAIAENGCPSDTLIQELIIYGTYAYAGKDTIVAKGQPLQLAVTGGVYYEWAPANGLTNPAIANPVATLQHDGSYIVTATTDAGCPSSDTINIKVYNGPEFYVPTAFTPNNDLKNDVFRFTPVGMTAIHYFRVYNRYGQLLYNSTNPSSGWDGTFNGQTQPPDTYVWMIEGKDYLGNMVRRKGIVNIIR